MVLPRVVEWNRAAGAPPYDGLSGDDLARRLRDLAAAADFPMSLRDIPVPREALPRLAEEASTQWAGRFSARPFDAAAALEIYQAAY
jgi:alcohol dehydrogenase class IV